MKKSHEEKQITTVSGAKVAIIQAQWHSEHTDRLVSKCRELLEQAGCALVDVHRVPGSYELPLAAKPLAKSKRYDALVISGAIVKGDTDHYEVILQTCIRELGKVMYDFEIPIIMELLPVHNPADIVARTEGPNNKGIEAAHAVVEILSWRRGAGL